MNNQVTIALNRPVAIPASESLRQERLSQAIDEFYAAIDAGQLIDRETLLQKYADIADELDDCLHNLDFIQQITPQLATGAVEQDGDIATASPRAHLGDFRILRELGRGGMGVVYEAEQLSIGRRVALKVLPFAAMLDKQQLNRFKNEARAAGTLDHPNIVAIHSVGCERGVHYYAMQLIEGRSLAEIIAEMKPGRPPSHDETAQAAALINHATAADTVKAALPTVRATGSAAFSTIPPFESREYYRTIARLGIQAAEALDHAHQNGILHRDIKPANLLLDDDGKLWITDFGLARIEQDAGMTMTGDLLGTLRYMSPEQALAKRVIVDHRSDIYSLGVTLYELLALRPAYPATDRQELLRQIAFEEPVPIRKLGRDIPTELDTIIGKAITKNPEERYQSANALANDLRAFLEDRPIKAKPPTWREQAAKWRRRHPAAVWAATFCLVATTIVAAASTFLVTRAYRRESAERQSAEASEQLAQANARRAEAISDFLVRAFESPNPRRDGRSVTVAEILSRAEKNLHTELRDQPLTQAALLTAIGRSRLSLGLPQDATRPLLEAHRLREAELGQDHSDTLESLSLLAKSYRYSDPNEEVHLLEMALKMQRTKLGAVHSKTLDTMQSLAQMYAVLRKGQEALELLQQVVDGRRATLGPDHPDTIISSADLAFAQGNPGNDAWASWGSEPTFREFNRSPFESREAIIAALEKALPVAQKKYGSDHPDAIFLAHLLAMAYGHAGQYDDAIRLHKECLVLSDKRYGPGDLAAEMSQWYLRATIKAQVFAYRHDGKSEKANQILADAIAQSLAEGRYGIAICLTGLTTTEQVNKMIEFALADDPARVPSQFDVATMWDLRLVADKTEIALPTFRDRLSSDESPAAYNLLGLALLAQGKADEAKAAFRSALTVQTPPNHVADEETAKGDADLGEKEELLKRANDDQFNSAYFLDLITEKEYVDHFGENVGYPWYYVGRRRELEHDQKAAVTAYTRCVEIGQIGTPVDQIPWTSALSRWRLSKLDPTTKH